MQREFLEHLEKIWREPDEGIWEVRGGREHFTYSKVMAWVAFDRAIKSAEKYDLPGPVDRWREIRDAIHDESARAASITSAAASCQPTASKELDASLLLLPPVGFLPAADPRVSGTIAAIERNLMRDGLVRRYDTAKPTTACRRARARSSPAASGWPTPI